MRFRSTVVAALVAFPFVGVAQDMPITQVLIPSEDWKLVAEGYRFTEGPAVDSKGRVYFVDVPASAIHRIELDGKVSLFAENTERTSGLMFGPDGRLYGCQNGGKKVVSWSVDGATAGEMQVHAELPSCNDLVVASDGSIYVTDPKESQVWLVTPNGEKRVVASGFKPNGVTLWRGEGTLVVTDSDAPHLWAFRVEQDGSLKYGEKYYGPLFLPSGQTKPGSDGMVVDADHRLYVATHAGLQMFDPTGRLGGVIAKPQPAFLSNVVFGGPDFRHLYVTTADKVYRRKVKPHGRPYFAEKAE